MNESLETYALNVLDMKRLEKRSEMLLILDSSKNV